MAEPVKRRRGRPGVPGEDVRSLPIKLSRRHREVARELGGGILAAGIREALDRAATDKDALP